MIFFKQTQDIQENKNDNSGGDLIETISICIFIFLIVACQEFYNLIILSTLFYEKN